MRLPVLICGCLMQLSLHHVADASIQPIAEIRTSTESGTVFDYDRALALSQKAIGNQLSDHHLVNEKGETVKISDYRGKPLIISMVYTSCYAICPMTTRHLSQVIQKARKTLGDESFAVAVIGFDTPTDTSDAMQYFANKQGISDKGWGLLSTNNGTIEALSKDTGFLYFPSSNGFDHLIQASIIDAEGKLYRQVYGQVFETPLLIDPLIELVLGRSPPEQTILSSLSSKIKLFCTTYDPVRDTYYFDYSLFLGMFIGGSIIVFVGVVVIRGVRQA
jgi:protein SCO1/2